MARQIDFTVHWVQTVSEFNFWTSESVTKKMARRFLKLVGKKLAMKKWTKWIKWRCLKKKKLRWEQCGIISEIISLTSKLLGQVWPSQWVLSLWKTSLWSRDTISEISSSDHMNSISLSASLRLRTIGIQYMMYLLFLKISNSKWFRTLGKPNLTRFISSEKS